MELHMRGQVARLAAYGGFAVVVVLLAVFGFIIWLTKPVPTGGENQAMATVTWISGAVVLLVLAAAHVALGRQLLAAARR